MPFRDRVDAGRKLAERLTPLRGEDVVVLGLPRGGVPVAAEVARALHAPLDVIVVRKLGVPIQPELAMGAIGEGGVRVMNDEVLRAIRIDAAEIARVEGRARAELQQRATRFRRDRRPVPQRGRTARLIDVDAPEHIHSVGEWYDDFSQTSDEEVVTLLAAAASPPARPAVIDREVAVCEGALELPGHLTVPAAPVGLVVFAHGSGSSRHSPRNQLVAEVLHRAGLGTLLFDLLTADEEVDRANVFDIGLLGARLVAATGWLHALPALPSVPVGYFGASTGAAAALVAAAELGPDIAAVVSRGGRPDLAASRLPLVRSPTLLIVGGDDHQVLDLNRRAADQLRCEHQLVVVTGATHLFEEPGTLQAAAELARDWFIRHLTAS